MLSQSAYLFSAKVFGYGLRLLLPIFLVRILTKADFGAYSQVFLVETLLKSVFLMGANQSLYYYVPRDLRNAGGYLLNALAIGTGFLSVGYLLASQFRVELVEATGLGVIDRFFPYLVAYSLLMLGNTVGETFLSANKLFTRTAVFDIVRQALASVATLLAAFLTRDLETVVLALVAARGISLVLVLGYIHFKLKGFRSDWYFRGIPDQVRYGALLGGAGLCWTLIMNAHQVMVNKFYDVETFAVYAAGLRQIPFLQFFSQSVAAVALVRFAQLEKENDWQGIRELWDKILSSMYGLAIPVTLVLLLLSRPLVTTLFTENYADAVPIFRWNTVAVLYMVLNPTLVLRAMNRNDVSFRVHLCLLVVLPAALYLGMRTWGLVGLIGVHAVMLNLGRIINHTVLNRMTPVHLPYVASRQSIVAFYRGVWSKGMAKLGRLRGA